MIYRLTRQFFTHMNTSPNVLIIHIYVGHSWPFSSEGSFAIHAYCKSRIRYKLSSPRTSDTHICCRAFSSGAVTTCFYDLHLSRLGFEHPTFRLRGQRSNPLRHRRSDNNSKCYEWLNGIENCMYLTFWISLIFIELILIRYFVVDSAMETCN